MTARTYSLESLTVTAAFAWCLGDFLEKYGLPNDARHRRNMSRVLKAQKIDRSHWDRTAKRWYSDAALAKAAEASTSVAGVLRLLGVPNTGGQHAHLSRRMKQARIDTSHFLGQAHSRGGKRPKKRPDEVLIVLPMGSGRPRTPQLRKALIASGVEHRCAKCHVEPMWLGSALTLIVDHINGDFLDNRLENLRFLCPNCHAQTSTWCRTKAGRGT